MKVILRKFAKDHFFLTMLIVFLFLALILSVWLTIKPNNLRKLLEFPKNMIEPPCLQKGSYKISPVHLSICLSVRPSVCPSVCDTFFSGSTEWVFLIFLHEDILPYILKSDKPGFWKIVFFV